MHPKAIDEPIEARASTAALLTELVRRHSGKLLVSCSIGIALIVLMRGGALPLLPASGALSSVKLWTVFGYFLCWLGVHCVRAARWYWLLAPLERVPMREVMRIGFVGFAAIVLLPFRIGEAVRPVMLEQNRRISAWAASGTVAAERIIDGLVLSTLLFLALVIAEPLEPLPDRIGNLRAPVALVPGAAYSALLLFACAFGALGLFYFRSHWAKRALGASLGRVAPRLSSWLWHRLEQVALGLGFLPKKQFTLPFLGLTLAYWLLNAASCWLLLWGCGFEGSGFAEACAAVGVLALGILVPNAPGYFGAFQLSFYAGLAMYFPPDHVTTHGANFVFFAYLIQMGIIFGCGLLALSFRPSPNLPRGPRSE